MESFHCGGDRDEHGTRTQDQASLMKLEQDDTIKMTNLSNAAFKARISTGVMSRNQREAMQRDDRQNWMDAEQQELESIIEQLVFE